MFTLVSLLGDSKNRPKSPELLWPLPGDAKDATVNDDDLREFFNRHMNERSRSKIQDNG